MPKQYNITNLRTFEAALDKFDMEVKNKIAALLAKTASECYKEIVATSPYYTGSYIASHRIAVNGIDGSDTIYKKEDAVPEGEVKAAALKQLSKLRGIKYNDTITVSNSVGFSNPNHYSWAANVEYTGWKGRGPYLVFEKALMMAIDRIPQYVQYIKMQGDKVLDKL